MLSPEFLVVLNKVGVGVPTLWEVESLPVTYSWSFVYVVPTYPCFCIHGCNQP